MAIAVKKSTKYPGVPNDKFANEKEKKYPVTSKARAISALAYFAKNKDQYSESEQKTIYANIKRLANQFGVQPATKDSVDGQQPSYTDLLIAARDSEEDAIALYLQVIAAAPDSDVAQLVEIVGDENDHSGIVSDLILRELSIVVPFDAVDNSVNN
jgi:hypothetical protein